MTEDDKLRDLLKHRKMTVACDVDGTLAEYEKWEGFFVIGKPRPHVVEWLRLMQKLGAYIIIHSCRATTADNKVYVDAVQFMVDWLKTNAIPYDEVWTAAGKPGADIYLDDKGKNPNCPSCMESVRTN